MLRKSPMMRKSDEEMTMLGTEERRRREGKKNRDGLFGLKQKNETTTAFSVATGSSRQRRIHNMQGWACLGELAAWWSRWRCHCRAMDAFLEAHPQAFLGFSVQVIIGT